MWVALDDVNVNGYDAFPNFVGGADLNALITDDAWLAAAAASPPRSLPLAELQATEVTWTDGSTHIVSGIVPLQNVGEPNTTDTPVTCTVPSVAVPTSDQLFGLPTTENQVDHIFRVETAEFQMFIGRTIDTGDETMRRAFIDYADVVYDANGDPVAGEDGKFVLRPVDPSVTSKRLTEAMNERDDHGKRVTIKPDILLHVSRNWIAGKNTGSLAVTELDSGIKIENPTGNFTPTGPIVRYKPDPAIKTDTAPPSLTPEPPPEIP
jgi:hypothetical protein